MRTLVFSLLCLIAGSAFALPSVEDVQGAVQRGDYPAAENLVREVLGAKPENAKAHYILAEILAHEGRIVEAKRQADMARQFDPQVRFTTPERFRDFEARLAQAANPRAPRAAANAEHGSAEAARPASGGGTVWIAIAVAIGAAFFFVFLRNRGGRPTGYGDPPASYGNAGYPPGPPPGAYPPGTPYPPQRGVGSTVAAGLGGLAAGALLERMLEGDHERHVDSAGNLVGGSGQDAAQTDAFRDQSIDFGQGAGWDSSDSGSGGGGGFDSGSGGDW